MKTNQPGFSYFNSVAFSLVIALLCFSSAPTAVLADDFTISTATTERPAAMDNENGNWKIDKDGKVEIPATFAGNETNALIMTEKGTFTHEGVLKTEKDGMHAFRAFAVNNENPDDDGGEVILKKGSKSETTGTGSTVYDIRRDGLTFTMEGGEVKASGGGQSKGFWIRRKKITFNLKDGLITATQDGGQPFFVEHIAEDFTFVMDGGKIVAEGTNAVAFTSMSKRASITINAGEITSKKGNAMVMAIQGNAEAEKDYEHLLKIGRGARLTSGADAGTALVIHDTRASTSRALVDIAGTLIATGEDGIGIDIQDQTGGFHKFEISGTVRAKTAIRKLDAVDLALVMTFKQNARIIGDVNMGSLDGVDGAGEGDDNDTIHLRDNARIIGKVDMGAGVDTLNLRDKARIKGEVDTGLGNDVLTMKDDAEIIGDVTLGDGDDSFKLAGAARVVGLVDGGADTVTEENPVSADNPGDTLDVTGMMADRRARAATSFSFRYQGFETIKGLSLADRKNYLVGINVKGQDGYDAEKESRLVSIEPTGQAVEARAQGILMDALHDLGDRRGRAVSERYASRPVQVAARGRMTGLLAPDTRPSMWGEGFGGFQRRGRDGYAKAYAFNHIGVAFGIEQDYRGERTRLGMLFGYVGGSFKTRPSSIKTDNKSFVLGLYGRHRLDEVRENLYLQGGLNFHFSKHDNRRQVLLSKSIGKNNHASMVKGKYDSWGLSPSLTLGYVSRLDSRFSLEPSVNLRYSVGFYDSYREKGEAELDDKLSVNSRTQQSLAGRLNLAGIYHLPDEAGSVALRLGLSHRRLFAGDLKGSVSGQAFHFKSAGSDSVNLLHAGLDITARLTESLSVNGRWEYSSSVGGVSDHGNNGLLSLAYEF